MTAWDARWRCAAWVGMCAALIVGCEAARDGSPGGTPAVAQGTSDASDGPGTTGAYDAQGKEDAHFSDAAADANISGAPAACPAVGAEGTTVGSIVADYSLLDCDGVKQTLHALCGTPVVLVAFTYAWCPTCIEITPDLDLIAALHGEDVAVVQILFESATGNPPTAATCEGFVKKHEITQHAVLIDPLKGMDVYYDHVVDESPGRVLVIDGRTMTLLHNSGEYESDHSLLYGWIADAIGEGAAEGE